MDHEVTVRPLDRHDLELPATFVHADPTEHCCFRLWIRRHLGLGSFDDVASGCSAHPVFAGSPREPDGSHRHIMPVATYLCKTQYQLTSAGL